MGPTANEIFEYLWLTNMVGMFICAFSAVIIFTYLIRRERSKYVYFGCTAVIVLLLLRFAWTCWCNICLLAFAGAIIIKELT